MHNEISHFYEFGDFRLDVPRQRLTRAGEPLLLPAKAIAALLVLLERQGQIVEREILLQEVWGQAAVEDANLTVAISTLRKTLGHDDPQTFIETIPRIGYRFSAEVREHREPKPPEDTVRVESAVPAPVAASPSTESTSQPASRRRFLFAGLGVLSSVALAGVLFWRTSQPEAPFKQFSLERLPVPGGVDETAFSLDGRWVAYTRIEGNQQSLWMYDLKTGGNALIVPPSNRGYRGLTFAPNAEFLYVALQEGASRERNLYRIPSAGGELQLVRKGVPSPIGVSPDGTQYAYVTEDRSTGEALLQVARFDQSAARVLARRKMPDFFTLDGPAWSPDGNLIVNPGGSVESVVYFTLYGVRVADGVAQPLTPQRWENVRRARWLADGSGLIVSIQAAAHNLHQLFFLAYPSGAAHEITRDISVYPRGADIAANRQMMIAPHERHVSTLWLADATGRQEPQPLDSGMETQGNEDGLLWLPDGRIMYVSRASGRRELWVMRPGARPQPFTSVPGSYQYPAVSADGRSLAVIHDGQLWRVNTDGTDWVQLTRDGLPQDPQITLDQQWVIYSNEATGRRTLWKIPLQGGAPSQLNDYSAESPVLSPDGQWIAYLYWPAPENKPSVAILPFASAAPAQLLPIPVLDLPRNFFRWSRDGKSLIYIADVNHTTNLWSYELRTGAKRQLTNFKTDHIAGFDLSPDGKQFVVSRFNTVSDLVLLRASK
jgi:Tol biopolymer transport system component/DNA-binding winged helix-turn-helix (wHTH) protein